MKEKIKQDLNLFLKEGKTTEVSVLRQILASFLTKEKEKKFQAQGKEVALTNEEAEDIVFFEAKKRKEAIESFKKGKRQDLVAKEEQELVVLEKYLPKQLTVTEVEELARQAIEKTKAKDIKDMGKVMQELKPQIKGRADGNLVSQTVKQLLVGRHSGS